RTLASSATDMEQVSAPERGRCRPVTKGPIMRKNDTRRKVRMASASSIRWTAGQRGLALLLEAALPANGRQGSPDDFALPCGTLLAAGLTGKQVQALVDAGFVKRRSARRPGASRQRDSTSAPLLSEADVWVALTPRGITAALKVLHPDRGRALLKR